MNLRYFYTRAIAAVLVALAAVTFGQPLLHAQIAGAGRSFVLTVPYIEPSGQAGTPLVRLLMTARNRADVTLTYTATGISEGFTIQANNAREHLVDYNLVQLPKAEGIFKNSVRISSTEPITAALVFDRNFVSEGYSALPDSLLGFEYVAIMPSRKLDNGGTVVVIGVHDQTKVTITPAKTAGSHAANVPFILSLNRGEVFQLLKADDIDADLSGTLVVGDKPCGVLSGSPCADLEIGNTPRCNPLMEQLPSIDSWGRNHVLAPLYAQGQGVYKVIARCDNTDFKLGTLNVRMNKLERQDLTGSLPQTIAATGEMMIAQMSTSTTGTSVDRLGDPSMMMVSAESQWSTEYDVYVPTLAPRSDIQGVLAWEHYLQVVVPTGFESTLLIDNTTPAWVRRDDIGTHIAGILRVNPGRHTIRSLAPVSVQVYGYSATDAYGFTPSTVRYPFPLQADSVLRFICGDTYTARITITNAGSVDHDISTFELAGDLSATLPVGTLPLKMVAGSTRQIDVQLRGLTSGKNDGWLILRGGACNQRLLAVRIQVYPDQLRMLPAFGGTIDFGGLPPTVPFIDTVVQLQNTGRAPLELKKGDIETGDFELVEPASTDFPLIIQPGAFLPVKLRFRPSRSGNHTGRLALFTKNCPDSQVVTLTGLQQSGSFIDATTPLAIRKLCGPKLDDTLRVRINNLGDLPLTISNASVVGMNAGEFLLLTSLNGRTVQPNDPVDIEVRYQPFGLGTRDARLQVVSNALNRDTFLIPFAVRNDTLAIELVSPSDSLDFGRLSLCANVPVLTFEIRNTGTVDLASLFFGLNNPGQFELTPPLPGLVLRDSSRIFQLKLTGTLFGQISDTLHIGSDSCLSLDIPISGYRETAVVDFETDTVDFGSINYCTDLVELVRGVVNNTLTPRTIRLEYLPVTPGIEYTLPILPDTLLPGDTLPFTFRLRNGHAGPVLDSIKLVDVDCGTTMTLYIRADVDTARPQFPKNVDFGPVLVQSTPTRTATITNPTRSIIQVSSLTLGSSNPVLQIVNPVPPVTINPGQSITVELSYAPTAGGEILFDSLRIVTDLPCSDTVWAMIHGQSVDDQRGVSLSWDTTQAAVGAEITMRLFWKQTSPAAAAEPLHLITSLRYDASILHAFAVRAVTAGAAMSNVAISRSGGEGVVELHMQGVFPDSGAIAEIRAIALLGDHDSTLLRFGPTDISFVSTGGPVRLMDTTSGIFRTTGICRIGPARLVRSIGMLRLTVTNPLVVAQPATVEFETVEDGPTELMLVDQLGRQVGSLLHDDVPAGAYSIALDPAGLAAGVYWLVLQTPTQRLAHQLLLVQ
jgi:hypothetical protein